VGERALDDGRSAHSLPSRAVNSSGNSGTPRVVGVRPDRVDHEAEPVSAVDLAHFGIGHFGPDELGAGEVKEPVDTPRVAVLHPRRRIRQALRPREQEWLAQAFDLNARMGRSARNNLESLVEWVPRPRQCHPYERLQNRENCGCFISGITGAWVGGPGGQTPRQPLPAWPAFAHLAKDADQPGQPVVIAGYTPGTIPGTSTLSSSATMTAGN
jgi:hypothetical protein